MSPPIPNLHFLLSYIGGFFLSKNVIIIKLLYIVFTIEPVSVNYFIDSEQNAVKFSTINDAAAITAL